MSTVVLQLYFQTTGNDPAFQVLRVTSPWDEAALSRSNTPTATAWGNWTGIVQTGWYSLDITELYKNWKNGTWPNYGIELAPTYTVQTNGAITSSDYQADPTLRPKLIITTGSSTPASAALESQTIHGTLDITNCTSDLYGGSCGLFVGTKAHREDLIATSNWSVTTANTLYGTFYLGMDGASWGPYVTDPPYGISVQVSSGVYPNSCEWVGFFGCTPDQCGESVVTRNTRAYSKRSAGRSHH